MTLDFILKCLFYVGAQSLGLSAASHTLIAGGGPEIIHYFNFSCNVELQNHLQKNSSPPIK